MGEERRGKTTELGMSIVATKRQSAYFSDGGGYATRIIRTEGEMSVKGAKEGDLRKYVPRLHTPAQMERLLLTEDYWATGM